MGQKGRRNKFHAVSAMAESHAYFEFIESPLNNNHSLPLSTYTYVPTRRSAPIRAEHTGLPTW